MESSGIRLKHVLQYILPSTGVLGLFIAFLLIYILPEIDLTLEQNRNETFQLIVFSGCITIILILILFYLVRQAILSDRLKEISSEELVDSKEKYKALLETSPEGIVMIVEEKPVYANMIFLAMTGCTEQEILEMNYADLFTEKSKSEHNLSELYEKHEVRRIHRHQSNGGSCQHRHKYG